MWKRFTYSVVAIAYLLAAVAVFFHTHEHDYSHEDSIADVHASADCSLCETYVPPNAKTASDGSATMSWPDADVSNGVPSAVSHTIDGASLFRIAPKTSPPSLV